MKQCFAIKERHPVLPDRTVQLVGSVAQASYICQVKNGDSIKLHEQPKYYVGVARMS